MNLKKSDSIESLSLSVRTNSSSSSSSFTELCLINEKPKIAWSKKDNNDKQNNKGNKQDKPIRRILRDSDNRTNNRSPQLSDVLKYLTFLKINKVE
jgi:hypothetical protein